MQEPALAAPTWKAVFSDSGYWRWSGTAQVVRLSTYLATFSYILAASEYLGRESLGGLMIAGSIIATIIMAPVNGKLFDRFGVTRLLPLQQLGCAVLMALLLLLVWQRAPSPVIVVACALLGSMTSASGGALRSLLNRMIPARLVDRGVAIDSLILELTVIAAPLIVVIITWFGSLGGMFAMFAAYLLASLMTWRLLPREVTESNALRTGGGSGILRNRAFLFWCLVSLSLGTSIGIVEVGAIAISRRSGGGNLEAALLIVALCLASIAAGFAWGTWADRIAWPMRRMGVGFMLVTVVAQLLVIVTNQWIPLTLLYCLLGATIAPSSILRQTATDLLTPIDQRAQAFATIFAANGLGFAVAGILHSVFSIEHALIAASSLPLFAMIVARFAPETAPVTGTVTPAPQASSDPSASA